MNKKLNKFIAILLCLIMTTASVAAAVPDSGETEISEPEQSVPVISDIETPPAPLPDETVIPEPETPEIPPEEVTPAEPSEPLVPEETAEDSNQEIPSESPAEQLPENVSDMLWNLKGSDELKLRLCELVESEISPEQLQKLQDSENAEVFKVELKALLKSLLPADTADAVLENLLSGTPEQFKAGFAELKSSPEATVPVFNLDASKIDFLNCNTLDEAEAFAGNHSQEEMDALLGVFSPAELRDFCIKLGIYTEPAPYKFPIDYTNVGRLLPPLPKISTFAAANDPIKPDNGLITSKTAEKNADGSYTITLETYTTGTVTDGEPIPVDVVLVLDESGSMEDTLESSKRTPVYENELLKDGVYYVQADYGYIRVRWCDKCQAWTNGCFDLFGHIAGSKYLPKTSADDYDSSHVQFYKKEASQSKSSILKSSAETFLKNIRNDAVKNDVDHNVSVIGFSNYGRLYTSLSDIRVDSNYNDAVNAVRGLYTDGGTYVDDGLRLAAQEFENSAGAGRQRVVIVFTDGIPGSGRWDDRRTQNSANDAIYISNSLKNTYGATVYSIAMISDADPEADISGDSSTALTNRFLHYISSNFPNASSMYDGGGGSQAAGYYLAANSQEALNHIFGAISEDIATPNIDLGTDTIVKDVISPYFNAPENTDSIKAYSADYLTNGSWAEPVEITDQLTINSANSVIDVSGFDYTANFISENGRGEADSFFGKKLIIKLNVSPKDGFLGGNSVPTNDSSSGVYDKGENIEFFPQPCVDVEIPSISIKPEDKHVYLNSSLTGSELTNGLVIKCGSTVLNDPANPVEDWQKAFVTIAEPESPDINGIKADTKYTVNLNVTPKNSGSISGREFSGSADIFVYKPEINCNDSVIFLGEAADYKDNIQNEVKWFHGAEPADPAKMTGTAPDVALSYSPEAGKFTTNTDVKIKVSADGEDVTEYSTIINPDGKDSNHDFTVKVISGTLKITKRGNAGADEGFIFNVTGPDGFTKTVSLTNGETLTLSGLPAGSYTVIENSNWAWKYDVSGSPQSVEIGSCSPNGEVTVTNTLKSGPVPENGDCFVRNISETVPVAAG